MCEFLIAVISTVLGGLLLTLVLFLLNEVVFKKRNFTGEWDVEVTTDQTEFKKYQGMKVCYRFHILQRGYDVSGSGEKIKEILSNGIQTNYERIQGVEIQGYYERKYFIKSRIYLNLIEEGAIRKYRTFFILEIENKNELFGKFSSTAAQSQGVVKLKKIFP